MGMRIDSLRAHSATDPPAKAKPVPTPAAAPPPPPLPEDRYKGQPSGKAVWTLSLDLTAGAGLGVTGSYQLHWDARQVVITVARSAGAYAGAGIGGCLTIQRTDAPDVKAMLDALGVTTAVTGSRIGVARLWAHGSDGKPISGHAISLGGMVGLRLPTASANVGDSTVLAEWRRR